MTRVEGWDLRLLQTVDQWRDLPFVWGEADCIRFALACGEAVRGAPLIPALPRYADAKAARRTLRGLGARELENALMMHLEPAPVALAQRGDIGIIIDQGAQCAVVCLGLQWAGKTERGIIHLPRHHVIRAFKV